jgi:hypothetical protein
MDLNLLTIARRASLGLKINNVFTNAQTRIDQIENINLKLQESCDFTEEEKLHNREFAIIGLISVVEQLLNEVLHQVLISYPKKFGNKKFEVDELIEEGSILELFYKKAGQKILDLAYGKFDKFIDNFKHTLELTSELAGDLVSTVNEIKCTRDCLIHSKGKASELYFNKVEGKARVRGVNDNLKIDIDYYQQSINNIRLFLSEIESKIPEKITDSKKAFIFRQMWESTCLNKRIGFLEAWSITSSNMIRPIDLDRTFGFSTSEMAVYNLFRHMYNQSHTVDFALYFQRWKPQSNEHQIALSWLDDQFYF